MLITPGPLAIVPNERGDGIWLKASDNATRAIATVWRDTPGTAPGNAVLMAHAEQMAKILKAYRDAGTKAKLAAAHADFDALRLAMIAAHAALTAREETAQ